MKVVHTAKLEWSKAMDHGPFQGRRKELGGQRLSAGLWELPPGKKSFPLHLHHGTEEALWVVSGHATVRTPEGLTPIGPGDWVSFPTGGPAHQLVNEGQEPFVYLALGHSVGVDVVEYPDSGKVACRTGGPGNGKRWVFAEKGQVDYFEGEE